MTYARTRRACSKHGLLLVSQDQNKNAFARLSFDPCALPEIIWALYEEDLIEAGIPSREALEDTLDAHEDCIPELEEVVLAAGKQRVALVRMLSTNREHLAGNPSSPSNPADNESEATPTSGTSG